MFHVYPVWSGSSKVQREVVAGILDAAEPSSKFGLLMANVKLDEKVVNGND
jgi:hypothetical protein